MRFHEQLKQPTTPAHDRACLEVMRMPTPSVLAVFFPNWRWESLALVTLKWFPEEPVREPHRGNLVGFIDLTALVNWESDKGEPHGAYLGIEVKTPGESMGNVMRQVNAYRGGLIRCEHLPMTYGQVDAFAASRFRLSQVALALPRDEITEDVKQLTTGVPLIAWPVDEFEALTD